MPLLLLLALPLPPLLSLLLRRPSWLASWLAPLLGGADSSVLQSFWLALPHYHLADLTPRLVFKMGPLAVSDCVGVAGTLGLQGAAISIFGLCLFRTRS